MVDDVTDEDQLDDEQPDPAEFEPCGTVEIEAVQIVDVKTLPTAEQLVIEADQASRSSGRHPPVPEVPPAETPRGALPTGQRNLAVAPQAVAGAETLASSAPASDNLEAAIEAATSAEHAGREQRAPARPTPKPTPKPEAKAETLRPAAQIAWHKLDYREAMILALVDGTRSRQAILERSALPAAQTEKLLEQLIERGLVLRG